MAVCPTGSKRWSIFVKTEATPGSLETFVAADAVRVTSFTPTQREQGTISRDDVLVPFGGGVLSQTGALGWRFQMVTELFPPVDIDDFSTCAQAAMWAAIPTLVTEEATGTYLDPSEGFCVGTDVKPCSIMAVEKNGNKYVASGCIGRITQINTSPGGRIMVTWDFAGQWTTPTDAPSLDPTYPNDTSPLIYRDAVFTESETGLELSNLGDFTLTLGQEEALVPDAGNAFASSAVFVGNESNPTLTIAGVLSQAETDLPVWSTSVGDTDLAIEMRIATYDSGGRECVIELPYARLSLPTLGETGLFNSYTLEFQAAPQSGGDQYRIRFRDVA